MNSMLLKKLQINLKFCQPIKHQKLLKKYKQAISIIIVIKTVIRQSIYKLIEKILVGVNFHAICRMV